MPLFRRKQSRNPDAGRHDDPTTTAFEIEFWWKEQVIYWEGRRGVVFVGGWGVDPVVTVVPDSTTWDRVVPSWLVGRADEVIQNLRKDARHRVVLQRDDSSIPTPLEEVTR